MKKRDVENPLQKITEFSLTSLTGNIFEVTKYTKGAVQFTKNEIGLGFEKTGTGNQEFDAKLLRLEWQAFSELKEGNSMGKCFRVIYSGKYPKFTALTKNKIVNDIRQALGDEKWKNIEKHLLQLNIECGHQTNFLEALWVELFAEPFGQLWLAVTAIHAFVVLEDDFAYGYLVSLLDQKTNDNESHLLRGKKNIESAKLGGQARSRQQNPKTTRTLQEMERLIETGLTISASANVAFKNKFGSSGGANKRLWTRHVKK